MSTSTTAKPVIVRNINATLAACEFIIENGGQPSKDQYNAILGHLRKGGDAPNWDAFPLTRSWFMRIS